MSDNKKDKTVEEILKEIAIEAFEEFKKQGETTGNKEKYSQGVISMRTHIHPSTLSRYLNPEKTSCPSFLEIMDKRDHLLKLAKRSKCAAARFVKASYADYIKTVPVPVEDEYKLNDEILKISHESHSFMQESMQKIKSELGLIVIIAVAALGTYALLILEDDFSYKRIDKYFEHYTNQVIEHIDAKCGSEKPLK